MGDYIVLIISCIFVNNILLAQFLGNCPFLGTSKKMETAVGMAMAVVFVLVMAGVITWMIYSLRAAAFRTSSICAPSPSSWSSRHWCSSWRCS
jgi:Na+-translocating ferredoxin:NAD+ oxidoreductase RnfA subunit